LKNDDLVDGDDEQDLIGVEDGEGDLVGGDDPEVVEGTSGRLLPGNLLVFTSTIANSNLRPCVQLCKASKLPLALVNELLVGDLEALVLSDLGKEGYWFLEGNPPCVKS